MHLDERLELVVVGAILLSVGVSLYNLPQFLMDIYTSLIPSFIVSGVLYTLFVGMGLDILADIKVKIVYFPVSMLTISVILTKLAIM